VAWAIEGRNCLITGATGGIGRATATELARRGARLFLVCRSRARGDETSETIARVSGNRPVEIFLADLSSQQSIRALAQQILARDLPIHVLLNNAGVINLAREVTADGIEATFAVNHLAYFLLTGLLLDRLKASAPARVVNVASDAHHWGTIDFADLQGEKRYGWRPIYGRSKLANILFTRELARRLDGTGVTVNCLHPGAVATNLGKQNGVVARALLTLARPFLRTPERGAETAVHLAASPEVDGVSGQYFHDRRTKRGSAESNDPTVARRLWEVSERLTGDLLHHPRPL